MQAAIEFHTQQAGEACSCAILSTTAPSKMTALQTATHLPFALPAKQFLLVFGEAWCFSCVESSSRRSPIRVGGALSAAPIWHHSSLAFK
eukprot:4512129-Amphidinium_carterae.1